MEETTKTKHHIIIYNEDLVYLLLMGIVFSLLGWLGENTSKLISQGFIDSRFHILPFIGIYALIPIAFHVAIGNVDDIKIFNHKIFKEKTTKTIILSNIISFITFCIFVFLGELAVGNLWDILFDVKLWNYSNSFLHFTQYTCFISTFGFGLAAFIIFKFIYNPLLRFFKKKISYKVALVICLTLGLLIFLDEIRLYLYIIITNTAPNYYKIVFFNK